MGSIFEVTENGSQRFSLLKCQGQLESNTNDTEAARGALEMPREGLGLWLSFQCRVSLKMQSGEIVRDVCGKSKSNSL